MWDAGQLRIRYFEHTFPLDPASVARVLETGRAPGDDVDRSHGTPNDERGTALDGTARVNRAMR